MNAPFKPNKQMLVSVSSTGKMHLPAELRKRLSLEKGGKLFVHEEEGGITLVTTKAHLDSLAAFVAPFVKGDSVDQFLADRKAEDARERDEDH